MAHKKGAGSTRNGRDSNSQRRGTKVYGGEAVRAGRALGRTGVPVSILTGRLYSGTRPSAEEIGVRGPVGCADGSHVVNVADHATLQHHGLRGEHAAKLRDSLERNGPAVFLFA